MEEYLKNDPNTIFISFSSYSIEMNKLLSSDKLSLAERDIFEALLLKATGFQRCGVEVQSLDGTNTVSRIKRSLKTISYNEESQSSKKIFTPWERTVLNSSYQLKRYPSKSERQKLATKLGVNRCRISTWFARKRFEEKKKGCPIVPWSVDRRLKVIKN